MLFEIIWLFSTIVLASILACSAKYFGKNIFPSLLAGSLVVAIFVAGKLGDIPILGGVALSASIIVYSMTFLYTDVMSELYGRKYTQAAVAGTALCYPIVFFTTQFSIAWEPSQFFAFQQSFEETMNTAVRVTIASFCSFSASQTFDVWAFHKIKEKTNGSKLWLRNNGSTMGSQLVDTVLFYTIAFAGILDSTTLIKLIVATYILKIVIAIIDTPFVYFVVGFVKSGKEYKKEANL